MARFLKRYRWFAGLLAVLGLSASALLLGCGQQNATPPEGDTAPPAVRVAAPQTAAPPASTPAPAAVGLDQSFEEATTDEAPAGQKLGDSTKPGLSVGKLYEAVVASWGQIRFVSPAGKRLTYTATLKTDLGEVAIDLWPDVAPNHVRNFVALARAGYYNGLEFDRTLYELVDGQKDQVFECVVAGCPECTGDVCLGSIGYWMKPELSATVKHEPGTVGAWHEADVETAACKFYITLSPAPFWDGRFSVFGKVTRGLDVVRTIRSRPVVDDDYKDRPQQPVVIRSVTIDCREVEAVQPR
jgi:cyclophilin family peptidyl-prolyl cis-trans isomerase